MQQPRASFSFDALWRDALQEFGSPDRGFWLTLRRLALAPGPTLRDCFAGEDQRLTRPVRFFLIIYGVYALVYLSSGAMQQLAEQLQQDMLSSMQAQLAAMGDLSISADEVASINPLLYWIQYPLAYEFFLVALLWLSSWPMLKGLGLNAAERLASTLYLYGVINAVQIPLFFAAFTDYWQAVQLGLALMMGMYMAWATHGLCVPRRRFGFMRGVLWWLGLQLLVLVMAVGISAKLGYDAAMTAHQAKPAAETSVPNESSSLPDSSTTPLVPAPAEDQGDTSGTPVSTPDPATGSREDGG